MGKATWVVGLALASLLGAGSPAAAKDLCIEDSFNGAIIWKKVKSMKKPGRIVPLTGLLVAPPEAPTFLAPVVGTAVTRADGMIVIGFVVLGEGNSATSLTATASVIVDQTLTGSGFRDPDGDFVQDDALSWTPIDCDTIAFP